MSDSLERELARLYAGEAAWVLARPGSEAIAGGGATPPEIATPIFSGSFNPLHRAHRALYVEVCEHAGGCLFEVAIENFTKGRHPIERIAKVAAQFAGWAPLLLTAEPTFRGKARLLSGRPTFVVGADVFELIVANPPWPEARFLVANRALHPSADLDEGAEGGSGAEGDNPVVAKPEYPPLAERFGARAAGLDWGPLDLPRMDVSSTELRRRGRGW